MRSVTSKWTWNSEKNGLLLEGRGVTKYFGGLAAVSEVSFHILPGEILGLIGPNGAGKTTLFNLIAGVYKPDHGSPCVSAGGDIARLHPNVVCKMGIARTFQITKPFLELTVLENALVGAFFGHQQKRHMEEAQERALSALNRVGLEAKAEKRAKSLNLVERKRLEVARALSTAPELLLLDEVVAGLNPKEALEMADFIGSLRQEGITILMIEHVMRAIMGLSDRLIVLHYGKKLAEGTPAEIAQNSQVIEAYLGGIKQQLRDGFVKSPSVPLRSSGGTCDDTPQFVARLAAGSSFPTKLMRASALIFTKPIGNCESASVDVPRVMGRKTCRIYNAAGDCGIGMLEIKDIDVFYGDAQALWEISLQVKEKEIVTLLGGNGAGKSTTLRAISGLLKPKKGSISLAGVRLDRIEPHQIILQGLSHVPEGRSLFANMTVMENLLAGAYSPAAWKNREAAIQEMVEIFPILKERRNQLAGTLSGGEQQMCAIARAMVSQPRVLLLDEPSLGLAPVSWRRSSRSCRDQSQRGHRSPGGAERPYCPADRASRVCHRDGKMVLEGLGLRASAKRLRQEAYLGI